MRSKVVEALIPFAKPYAPFIYWIVWFLTAWVTIVIVGGFWGEITSRWGISVAMLIGSYVAGSTPMGGGTIGFPILVLLFQEPATMGRNFGFVIQSVGMSSATIFLLCARRAVAWRLLVWSFATAAVVIPIGVRWIAPLVSDAGVKLTFACIWGAFGVLTLYKLRELIRADGTGCLTPRIDTAAGIAVGLVGGVAASLTGVGIDMVLYTVLVLLYRCDIRIAVATSVMVMAASSLVGTITTASYGLLGPDVFYAWLAAAPVVLFGAPIGVLVLYTMPRAPTMVVIACLCIGQLFWTIFDVGATWSTVVAVAVAMIAINAAFHVLHASGARLVPAKPGGAPPVPPDSTPVAEPPTPIVADEFTS